MQYLVLPTTQCKLCITLCNVYCATFALWFSPMQSEIAEGWRNMTAEEKQPFQVYSLFTLRL